MSTDIEIIEDAVKTLGNISIPVSLFSTIGIPIARVHGNLGILLEAVKKKIVEEKHAEEEPQSATESEEIESN